MPAQTNQPIEKQIPKELVVVRTFQAPRALVFKAWTDPKQVAQWWGPRGFTNPVCEWDARPGGLIHVEMRGPDGISHPMKGVFREVVKPERLVFTVTAFEDEHGNPRLENINTVTFTEMNGVTEQTLHVVVLKSGPEIAQALAGMNAGWNQSLDKLMEFVAKLK
ncbi:MAG TPA: SRPBCC domain-containing protein [Verrucomicrobiae bacterium]|nr:SRPBCC domain-containing protein [Verrucomicrobiae bacterium]